MVADIAAGASEPWWIIGSAAVALHGAPVTGIHDVDVIMGPADARYVLERADVPSTTDTNHPQFRSKVFGTWRDPPLPVEVFAGFSLADSKGWHPVLLESRQAVSVAGRTLYVPSIGELHRLLLSFGRPKDLDRARLLASLSAAELPPAPAQPPDPHRSSS
ncbi:MAG TPA: hypothetical protein VF067_04950 [Sphingomicrobium sp.]